MAGVALWLESVTWLIATVNAVRAGASVIVITVVLVPLAFLVDCNY